MTVVRRINYVTTSKTPAKMPFNRKVRGILQEFIKLPNDEELCDRDTERKAKSAVNADLYRGAQQSEATVGDIVLLR